MTEERLNYTIRPVKSVEEARAMWWPLVQDLGWNRSKENADTLYHATKESETWLVVVPESTNKPEGCIIAFTYPNNTGWVGTHMVNAAFRGQGFGYPLTRAIFSTLKSQFDPSADNFFVGVDSTPKQLEPNKTQGFVDCARIHLMTRKSLAEASLNVTWSNEEAVELHDLRDVDSALVTQLDLAHTGLNRKAHWDQLVSPDHAPGYAIMSEDGTLTGFIYARRCPDGRRIGPLYAATYANARQLLHKMMNDFARSKSGNMVAEIFGTNKEGQKVFEELGWTATEEMYHRMWLFGKVPVEQQEGGTGAKGMYAIYDACTG